MSTDFSSYLQRPQAQPALMLRLGQRGGTVQEKLVSFIKTFLCSFACSKKDCRVCRRIELFQFPDLLWLDSPKADPLKVESIREMILQIQLSPIESDRRLVVINHADDLSVACQNTLLKTLEEPLANRFFWLVVENPHKLLPTVRSRCLQFLLEKKNEEKHEVVSFAELLEMRESLKSKEEYLEFLGKIQGYLRNQVMNNIQDVRALTLFEKATEMERKLATSVNLNLMFKTFLWDLEKYAR